MQPLPERMLSDPRLQLTDQLRVPAQGEVRLDPGLHHNEVKLAEAGDLTPSELRVDEVGERRASPKAQARAQRARRAIGVTRFERAQAFVKQSLEARGVELVVSDSQQVAGVVRHEHLGGLSARPPWLQRRTQVGHVGLQGVQRAVRWAVFPQLLKEPVARHNVVRLEEQQRENPTLLRTAESYRAAINDDLQRPEDPELQTPFQEGSVPAVTFVQRGTA
jgi:hypothetical protein